MRWDLPSCHAWSARPPAVVPPCWRRKQWARFTAFQKCRPAWENRACRAPKTRASTWTCSRIKRSCSTNYSWRIDRVSSSITELAAQIRLLLMDVDGVLTDGILINVPDAQGNMVETKGFDSQDGISLQWCSWHGIKTGVISGRVSPATAERARQCKMAYVYQGHIEKIPILEEILADARIDRSEVAYIGDDFTDTVIMHRVGFAVATANARPEVKREAHYVTQAVGGEGAVREVVELLLKAQGKWSEILTHYEIGGAAATPSSK